MFSERLENFAQALQHNLAADVRLTIQQHRRSTFRVRKSDRVRKSEVSFLRAKLLGDENKEFVKEI
ncbi:MAG: hypothetical protein C4288_12960 [Leptolyngbya sp. ERB_1_1]